MHLLLKGWSTGAQVDHAHLGCGPSRALTHIGHAEAETVGAAQRIVLLEVVEPRFAQIAVGPHHVHLWSNGSPDEHQMSDVWSPDGQERRAVFTLQVQGPQGSALVLPAASHSQRTH